MARGLRLLLQTGTVFISNGAIPALLRLQKRITPCGRVLYVTATYPDNLVTKTYIKYRKELGADWAIRQANNDQEKHLKARAGQTHVCQAKACGCRPELAEALSKVEGAAEGLTHL